MEAGPKVRHLGIILFKWLRWSWVDMSEYMIKEIFHFCERLSGGVEGKYVEP